MIHYITVATEFKQYLPYLKNLLPELIILGLNTKWKGFIYKFQLIIEYLKTINENDIVCIIDAYDILPTKKIGNIENKFKEFNKNNPQIKMVIGYDFIENVIIELLAKNYFGFINNNRINAGNYIGYSKDIINILSYIIQNNPDMIDDQKELTIYANKFPNDIYVDIDKIFFNVVTNPLMYVENDNDNYEYGLIHANGNGFLDKFLFIHHNIIINPLENINIHYNNYCDFIRKFKMYTNEYTNLLKN